jgi:hypothetical protein
VHGGPGGGSRCDTAFSPVAVVASLLPGVSSSLSACGCTEGKQRGSDDSVHGEEATTPLCQRSKALSWSAYSTLLPLHQP